MSQATRILILLGDGGGGDALAKPLREQGLEVLVVTSPGVAIKSLREQSFDLMIVDAALQNPSPLGFLTDARKYVPQTLRALYESSPQPDRDLRPFINDAGACAVFTDGLDPELIRKAVADHSAANGGTQAKTAPPRLTAEAIRNKVRVDQLKREVTALRRQLRDAQEAERPAETRSAVAKAAPPPTHGEMKLDPNAPDRVEEIARLLFLLLERPEIRLPVLPQVGAEAMKLISREDSTFEQIARIVGLDPSMSARVLGVANSALYAGAIEIKSVKQAVSRIGLNEARNVLQAVAAENLFQSTDKDLADLMPRLWMHSLTCAYANEIIARTLHIKESDDFFTMGLLHDIGKLLIVHLLEAGSAAELWSRNQIDETLIHALFASHHNDIGVRLMEKWGYPKPFHDVIGLHNDDAGIQEHDEPVVVTYYSNQLARMIGYSIVDYDAGTDPLQTHDLAQALNLTDQTREKIETEVRGIVGKIEESFLGPTPQ